MRSQNVTRLKIESVKRAATTKVNVPCRDAPHIAVEEQVACGKIVPPFGFLLLIHSGRDSESISGSHTDKLDDHSLDG